MLQRLIFDQVLPCGILAASLAVSSCDRNSGDSMREGSKLPGTSPDATSQTPPAESQPGEIRVDAAAYPSLHEAVAQNPGRVVDIGAMDWVIDRRLLLAADRSGLRGTGRIIQTNPREPIVEVRGAQDVSISDVTLARAPGAEDCEASGLVATGCRFLAIDRVKVLDNRSRSPSILLDECFGASITGCTVRNYMRVAVDDRTEKPQYYGFAFLCIDGTGISVRASHGTLVSGNTVSEENLRPTPEMKEKHKLGTFVKKNPDKGSLVSQEFWDAGYVPMWQQGSAIYVGGPETSRLTRILGNLVLNAAQGIDLHSDQVVVANNIVDNAFIGMKAMHGSRNVIIEGNQFFRNTLWSIGLMPGTASHGGTRPDGKIGPANHDGWSIIANNIISDFGYGDAFWIWKEDTMIKAPLRFDVGQEDNDPPLTDVVITGNVIQPGGHAGPGPSETAPRFNFAVLIEKGRSGRGGPPQNLHFRDNLLPPGEEGVSNQPLPE